MSDLESLSAPKFHADDPAGRDVLGGAGEPEQAATKYTLAGYTFGPNGEMWPSYIVDPAEEPVPAGAG